MSADAKYIDAIERITQTPIPRIEMEGEKGGEQDKTKERPKRQHNRRRAQSNSAPTEAKALSGNDASLDALPAVEQSSDQRGRSRQRKEAQKDESLEVNEAPVKGLGDHVPAFMLREVELS